jgi:hypothetical protein
MGRRRITPGDAGEPAITLGAVSVQSVEENLRKDVEARVKSQLGLEGELPADVKEAIDSASKASAAKAVQLSVAQAAEDGARAINRGAKLDLFDDKIKIAADSIVHIGASSEVDQVLQQRAELLAKKRKALVTAGFSDEEAMQILLADIAARQH